MATNKNTNEATQTAAQTAAQEPAAQTPAIDLEALKALLREDLKAELKAEVAAELKAEAEAEAAAAETAKKHVPDPSLEEYVQVQLFKDGKDYKDDVFVSVNGENCVIKRGHPVKIKRKFALVLEQSQAQDVRAAEYAESMQREYDEQVKYFNL